MKFVATQDSTICASIWIKLVIVAVFSTFFMKNKMYTFQKCTSWSMKTFQIACNRDFFIHFLSSTTKIREIWKVIVFLKDWRFTDAVIAWKGWRERRHLHYWILLTYIYTFSCFQQERFIVKLCQPNVTDKTSLFKIKRIAKWHLRCVASFLLAM